MVDLKTQQEVLHKPFSIEKHKETFVNYLEVCIDRCGIVHYAVPSHQEWLISRYMKEHQCTREQLFDLVPTDYYFDIMLWLCYETKCIAVWDCAITGRPNELQILALERLKTANLYRGDLSAYE